MSEELTRHGLGQLLDIVPNHMANNDRRNRWWWDVLRCGRESPSADVFDIDWEHPLLPDRVLIPQLGASVGEVVEGGDLQLIVENGIVFAYHELRAPLRPETQRQILAGTRVASLGDALVAASSEEERNRLDAELMRILHCDDAAAAEVSTALERINAEGATLLAMVEQQHHCLSFWRDADRLLNYRRFFDIATLVGVRVEDSAVLDRTHVLVDALLDSERVDGIRIDHVDGLRWPRPYLERMRNRHRVAWIIVEKIPGGEGTLPPTWPVEGTTGYEFGARIAGVFLEPSGWQRLRERWAELTGEPEDFEVTARQAKDDVLRTTLRPDLARLLRLAEMVCAERPHDAIETGALEAALTALLREHEVYRTYIEGDEGPSPTDRMRIEEAAQRVRTFGGDTAALDVLLSVLLDTPRTTAAQEVVLRFQQVSSVVMAKGVEDTAFYRDAALSALCEVGGSPAHAVVDLDTFHAANGWTQRHQPATLLALSTHDSKRSEDVRGRLLALSEMADVWAAATTRWRRPSTERIDAPTVELFHQTLVGAWPIDTDRMVEYMGKAIHEAKRQTSWVDPDAEYDAAVERFVRERMANSTFLDEVAAFAGTLAGGGEEISLSMTLLQLTSPGVPDIYQGAEVWDLSLVDPDNRRPVDFDARRRVLAAGAGEGWPKLHMIREALELRRRHPQLFDARGDYTPLRARGPAADHVVAFARGASPGAVTVVTRFRSSAIARFRATTLTLPEGEWIDVLVGGAPVSGVTPLAMLTGDAPVALLERVR